jgi:hypothetical protein
LLLKSAPLFRSEKARTLGVSTRRPGPIEGVESCTGHAQYACSLSMMWYF